MSTPLVTGLDTRYPSAASVTGKLNAPTPIGTTEPNILALDDTAGNKTVVYAGYGVSFFSNILNRVSYLESNAYENVMDVPYANIYDFVSNGAATTNINPGDAVRTTDGAINALKIGGSKIVVADYIEIRTPDATITNINMAITNQGTAIGNLETRATALENMSFSQTPTSTQITLNYGSDSVILGSATVTNAGLLSAADKTAIGNMVRFDAQSLTAPQQSQVKNNLGLATVLVYDAQSLTAGQQNQVKTNLGITGTNLGNTTAASTVTVTSSTGTSTTLAAATASIAGVMTAADKSKLDGLPSSIPATNLGNTTAASTVTITSSTGTSTTLAAATASIAGVMTAADKSKLDGLPSSIPATNLGNTQTTTSVTVTSSTGSSTTIAGASGSIAGVMSSADKTKLDGLPSSIPATNLGSSATTTNVTVTSSTGSSTTLPVASAAQAGVITKANYDTLATVAATSSSGQYFRGDKTWATLDKSAVGLSNVDNTSDLLKPISNAVEHDFASLAGSGAYYAQSLSINADPTKFDVGAVSGWITTQGANPTRVDVHFAGRTAITVTNLATSDITYVALDQNGNIVQQTTPFTEPSRRQYIVLGILGHATRTAISSANLVPSLINGLNTRFEMLNDVLGVVNVSGNVISAVAGTLQLARSTGRMWNISSNYSIDPNSPDFRVQAALSPQTGSRLKRDAVVTTSVTTLDPNQYDLNGTLTAVPSNRYSIQRIYVSPRGEAAFVYGQNIYTSMANALAAIDTEAYVENPILSGIATIRAFVIVRGGTTNLATAADATIVAANKFGASGGGGAAAGGTGSTNLSVANILSTTLDIVSDTGTDATVPSATLSTAGLMSAADKTKLDGLPSSIPATNLGSSATTTAVTVTSSTGTSTTLPVASTTQAGVITKANFDTLATVAAASNSGQYFRGDKTWATLDKSVVGLSNVDNTSDAAKPISLAASYKLSDAASSGVLYCGPITISGADTVNIGQVKAQFNYHDGLTPHTTECSYAGGTNVYVGGFITSYPYSVLVMYDDATIGVEPPTFFNYQADKQYTVALAVLWHTQNTTLQGITVRPEVAYDSGVRINTMSYGIGFAKARGLTVYKGNTGLTFGVEAGAIWCPAAGAPTIAGTPNDIISFVGLTPGSSYYQEHTIAATSIVPDRAWNGATLVNPIVGFTIQEIYLTFDGKIAVYWGKDATGATNSVYTTMAAAESAIATAANVNRVGSNALGLRLAYLIIHSSATDWTDAQKYRFIQCDKFGAPFAFVPTPVAANVTLGYTGNQTDFNLNVGTQSLLFPQASTYNAGMLTSTDYDYFMAAAVNYNGLFGSLPYNANVFFNGNGSFTGIPNAALTDATTTGKALLSATNADAAALLISQAPLTVNNQVGTTYTTVASDAGKVVTFANASPITVTLSNLPAGTSGIFEQFGAGQVTFVSGTLTLRHVANLTKTAGIYSRIFWRVTTSGTDIILSGDMS